MRERGRPGRPHDQGAEHKRKDQDQSVPCRRAVSNTKREQARNDYESDRRRGRGKQQVNHYARSVTDEPFLNCVS